MATKRTCVAAGLVCLAGWLACGCESQQELTADESRKLEAGQLIPKSQAPIADVPIPMGFSLDEGHSRSFAAAGTRYIDHVYEGKADKFAVARFYKNQMPRSRWVLVTDMFVQGEVKMDFEKQTEKCRIVISGGGTLRHTRIGIQVWTSGRIPGPTESKQSKES